MRNLPQNGQKTDFFKNIKNPPNTSCLHSWGLTLNLKKMTKSYHISKFLKNHFFLEIGPFWSILGHFARVGPNFQRSYKINRLELGG